MKKMITSSARRNALGAGLAAVAVAVSLFGAAPAANAATSDPAGDAVQDCAFLTDTGQEVCVDHGDDLHAAVYDETGYTVIETQTAPSTAQIKAARAAAAVYVVAKLYDDANYGGGVKEIDASGSCSGSTIWNVGDIGSGWYGRVSSFAGYSGCRVKIWEKVNFKGASLGYLASSKNVGSAMNDQTRSVQAAK